MLRASSSKTNEIVRSWTWIRRRRRRVTIPRAPSSTRPNTSKSSSTITSPEGKPNWTRSPDELHCRDAFSYFCHYDFYLYFFLSLLTESSHTWWNERHTRLLYRFRCLPMVQLLLSHQTILLYGSFDSHRNRNRIEFFFLIPDNRKSKKPSQTVTPKT